MTKRGERVGKNAQAKKREGIVQEFWGDELGDLNLWDRTKHVGFTTIPRTLSYINRVIDALSGPGSPVSSTYFTLWCHVYDESFIEIKNREVFAFESGFSGQRAVSTWMSRMRKLRELGLIRTKPGTSGEFHYVLMLNPLAVIKDTYETQGMAKDERYNALYSRMSEVGAEWE